MKSISSNILPYLDKSCNANFNRYLPSTLIHTSGKANKADLFLLLLLSVEVIVVVVSVLVVSVLVVSVLVVSASLTIAKKHSDIFVPNNDSKTSRFCFLGKVGKDDEVEVVVAVIVEEADEEVSDVIDVGGGRGRING